jgi:hypothetical protein
LKYPEKAGQRKGSKMSKNYSINLTARQVDALYQAIRIFEGSYSDYSDADLKDFDVKRELLSLRQVEAKLDATALDATTDRVEA